MTALLNKQEKVITGNAAAAYGALLCRPDVIAVYPITPQSEVIEQLAKFHSDGVLDCEYVTVEGENSAQNVVCGASMAGGRVFTATSSYGLVYMYDALLNTAGYRAPVVMINVNREPPGIHAVYSGQQDMISVRDSGWVLLVAENCQEILDLTITIYVNHCERADVIEQTAVLFRALTVDRLHLHRLTLGARFDRIVFRAVSSVFADRLLRWMLVDDEIDPALFFKRPRGERSALAEAAAHHVIRVIMMQLHQIV